MKYFLELAIDRYSVRKLESVQIPQADIDKIIEAGLSAPTGVNLQPFGIWMFQSDQAREKLLSCTKMKFIAPAEIIFVIGAKAELGWTRPFDQKHFAEIDASIVATHMMLEIHDLGYGSTWIGHFDAEQLKRLYPEMSGYELIALLPVGGISPDCEPSDRHSTSKSREELVQTL